MIIKITGIHPEDAWYDDRDDIVGREFITDHQPELNDNGWYNVRCAYREKLEDRYNDRIFWSVMWEEVHE